jgi:dipeptidyl aminopeptidase/acylaminoacyl peptidase
MGIFALPATPAKHGPAQHTSQARSRRHRSRLSCITSGFRLVFILTVLLLGLAMTALCQEPYRQPPKEVLEVLHARTTPQAIISPSRDNMLLIDTMRYPPIAVISEPMLRLAGLRINPNTNGARLVSYETGFTIKRISDGAEHRVAVPADAKLSQPEWSPDGKHFAFTNTASNTVELWVGSADSGEAHKVKGVIVNAAYGRPIHWMPDSRTLLVQAVVSSRGNPPAEPTVPKGPHVQETHGKGAPVATYEDLLANPHDEDLFDYYATSQLALVDIGGKVTPIGDKGIFLSDTPSPDGNFILVARLHRPYSYLHPHFDFPKEVEVWDHSGKSVYKLASIPLADRVPIEGVQTGPRDYQWRSDQPATLAWVEALDGGDTRKAAEYRDKLVLLKAPFTSQPVELIRTTQRFAGVLWGEKDGVALVSDYDRKKRWSRTLIVNADNPSEAPRELWGRNQQDRYKDPGTPILRGDTGGGFGGGGGGGREGGAGRRPILQSGDYIYLRGEGASPKGDRPFLDRLNLKTLKTERLFKCDDNSFETVVALLDDGGSKAITRRETPASPPNYFVHALAASDPAAATTGGSKALTEFPDPAPQIKGITKQLVTYKRQDGVPLSFTLYLPPGYKQGERLPTVVWAYPLEYNDAATAGQVTGSTNRFTTISGPSELFFLLEGYAVLDNAAMPIVGDPDTVNNTYVEQLTMDAKAAIDKAAEMGVTDPDRVGVGGHSYGAFMTANLLAHTRLFRAGIARSGAYNRTLTPFGFQSERRTFWEAIDLYMKMSPFAYANAIKDPILLMHGEADNNSGTFPIQSERMYQALRGNGATVRLVTLPDEAHGYSARESVEHTLYEMISWFDRYVKHAAPKGSMEEKAAN